MNVHLSFDFALYKKAFALFFILIFLSIIINPLSAKGIDLKIDNELKKETGITRPIEKVLFSPVKINKVLQDSNEKYSQEIAYFFYKLGFKSSPATYVLFENSEYFKLNSDWTLNQFENNLNQGTLFVLLAYEENFDLQKFQSTILEFSTEVLQTVMAYTDLNSNSNLELKNFVVEKSEELSSINFSDYTDNQNLQSFFNNINFSDKKSFELVVDTIPPIDEVLQNTVLDLKINIKNNSDFDLILSNKNILKFSFENESPFFVNDVWLDQKTASVTESGFIKKNSSKEFAIQIQAPLLPEEFTDEITITLNDKEIGTQTIALKTKDSGIKLLKILETGLGYLNVREEPDITSKEIGRAAVGKVYVYTEISDGYYKIDFEGKEGWVAERYLEILDEE